MSKAWGRWWPVLATVVLVLAQWPVVFRTATDPVQSDFVNYLIPARVLAAGGDLGALYEADAFAKALSRTGLDTLGSFVPQPPANALWLLPFARTDPVTAKGATTAVLLLSLLGAWACLRRLAPTLDPWLVAMVVMGPALAIRNGLAFGQPYLVLSLFLISGTFALERGHAAAGGFLLGLGLPFKPYAAPVGLALALNRATRGRAAAGFALGASLPVGALLALAGHAPLVAFWTRVLPWMQRGSIQDPFSPVWGSATALADHLFRFERDLNPHPWLHAPGLAAFLGAAIPMSVVAMGVLSAARAFREGPARDAVGTAIAFGLAASPFAASYHLVLLTLPAFALCSRLGARPRLWALAFWLAVGSSWPGIVRILAGPESVLGYSRFIAILLLGGWLASPYLRGLDIARALAFGVVAGALSVATAPRSEAWLEIGEARGYSMTRPHFCDGHLRWLSPDASGRRLISHGGGVECTTTPSEGLVSARFSEGSWNIYWTGPERPGDERRLTFSDANEFDPVLAPDGCSVVFASDQGRGLGSNALYRMDVSGLNPECGKGLHGAAPR